MRYSDEPADSNYVGTSDNLAGAELQPVLPLFTYILIGINVLVFLLTSNQITVTLWGANNQIAVQSGEYYRLVTAMFLHADISHLAFNMIALFSVGSVIESIFGHVRFLLVYLLGGLGGSLASILLNDANTLSVGASGAVFALFGAEMFYHFKYGEGLDERLNLQFSLSTIALNLLNGLRPNSGIDNWAHAGGVVSGGIVAALTTQFMVLTYPPSGGVSLRERRKPGLLLLAGISFALVALLVGSAFTSLLPRTMTVDNLTFTLPGSWQTSTDFEDVPLCQERNFECLLVGLAGVDAFFEIQRYADLAIFQSAQDDLEAAQTEADERDSITEVTVDGHEAVLWIFLGSPSRFLLLIRDGDTVVRFYFEAPSADFDRYLDDIEAVVSSIRFDES